MSVTVSDLQIAGRWIPAKTYAAIHSLPVQTLVNWRFHDRKAGRSGAAPGYPPYRYFGGAVRYWLPADAGRPEAA